MLKLQHIDHIALTVSNPEASARWYQEVLGLQPKQLPGLTGYPLILGVGQTYLNLFPTDTADPQPTPDHNTLSMRHVAFRVDAENYQQALTELPARDIKVTAIDYGDYARSLFCQDPDGHLIELMTYL
jgi:glyoxylase I family protein